MFIDQLLRDELSGDSGDGRRRKGGALCDLRTGNRPVVMDHPQDDRPVHPANELAIGGAQPNGHLDPRRTETHRTNNLYSMNEDRLVNHRTIVNIASSFGRGLAAVSRYPLASIR
jgi:hypothetical protein